MRQYLFLSLFLCFSSLGFAQPIQNQVGAWYMYFWNTTLKASQWGFQGDLQHRNWDYGSDLEQIMLRGGLTYQLEESNAKFTLGYASIISGEYGSSKATNHESRIYQEALLNNALGKRLYLTHRYRYEQRILPNDEFKTRWRYATFANVPINKKTLEPKTVYFAFYNELFIHGPVLSQNQSTGSLFDRNRLYGAFGYVVKNGLRMQLGIMNQTTANWSKNQIQVSLHHTFKL